MWKERQATELAKIGVKQTEKTPVCCSGTGGWYRIDNFEYWWGVWRKEHGFESSSSTSSDTRRPPSFSPTAWT